MMTVDLNPIRAGINNNLEDSDFTSIQDRLFAFSEQRKKTKAKNNSSVDKDETRNGHETISLYFKK